MKHYPTWDHRYPGIRAGMKFEHSRVLSEEDFKSPAVCVITNIKDGMVYWRLWNSIHSRDYFPIEENTKWIKRWIK